MKLATVQNSRARALDHARRAAKGGADRAARGPCQRGFTLAETLAALVFMAIVIPVAVEALHVASGAGEIAVRKAEAGCIADRVLNQSLVMTNWMTGAQSGAADQGADEFHWTLKSQNWPQDAMELLTANVTFSTQGREYSVELSTLASLQNQTTPMGTQGKTP
ncbi:MAG: type II secretion system protein [Limisphaerales bacterium]